MRRRGFTLIEVMVVLSILAIIAILAYNFFGNTMKEARTKQLAMQIGRDMQLLSDAYQKYHLTDELALNANYVNADHEANFVDTGIIKSLPLPPMDAFVGCNGQTDPVVLNYQRYVIRNHVTSMYSGVPGTSANIWMRPVTGDICAKFNEIYTSLGNTYDTNPGYVTPVGPGFCYKDAATDCNYVNWHIEQRD